MTKDREKQTQVIDIKKYIDMKIKNLSKGYDDRFNDINLKLDNMHETLNSIANVRVNGSAGLTEVLTELYKSTAELRANQKMSSTFKEWISQHKLVRLLVNTRGGIIFSFSVIAFIVLCVLHVLGVPVNPLGVVHDVLEALVRVI